jgi:DNA invertase Pin-like site-specific DNA recombinase
MSGAEMMVGYARVSTDGQTLDSQRQALTAAGAERIHAEKVSGAVTDRTQLRLAIDRLLPGDVLLVTRLDRLARSTRDLLNTLDQVTKRGAGFRSLAEPMIDTTSPHGRLVLEILAAIGSYERELIRARTTEGRARARERGVKFGRRPSLSEYQAREVVDRVHRGETMRDVARSYAVSHSTVSRLMARVVGAGGDRSVGIGSPGSRAAQCPGSAMGVSYAHRTSPHP